MTKVTDGSAQKSDRAMFICDFSPPRGGSPELLGPVRRLEVDFVSVAYNPGKSTRVNSVVAAHWIKANTNKDVVFTLATRDMNKVAIQSLLLGADLLGLQNVVVVKGDEFNTRDLSLVKDVNDYRPTELIRSIASMNEGLDFRGLRLRSPTDFCIGASIDLGRGVDREAGLTRRKIEAGAHFLISQPTFDTKKPKEFAAAYERRYGQELSRPVFHGLQVMTEESIVFGNVPEWVTNDLAKGRSGSDIALQVLHGLVEEGLNSIYLVPPILRGGRRDYEMARAVLESFRG